MGAGLCFNRSALQMCLNRNYSQPPASWTRSTATTMDHLEELLRQEVRLLLVAQRPREARHLDLYVIAYWVLVVYLVHFLSPILPCVILSIHIHQQREEASLNASTHPLQNTNLHLAPFTPHLNHSQNSHAYQRVSPNLPESPSRRIPSLLYSTRDEMLLGYQICLHIRQSMMSTSTWTLRRSTRL